MWVTRVPSSDLAGNTFFAHDATWQKRHVGLHEPPATSMASAARIAFVLSSARALPGVSQFPIHFADDDLEEFVPFPLPEIIRSLTGHHLTSKDKLNPIKPEL